MAEKNRLPIAWVLWRLSARGGSDSQGAERRKAEGGDEERGEWRGTVVESGGVGVALESKKLFLGLGLGRAPPKHAKLLALPKKP